MQEEVIMTTAEGSTGNRIQRKHKRYIIEGPVKLQGNAGEGSGVLVNLGRGGVLIRSDSFFASVGEKYTLRFAIHGYDQSIETGGVVVGARSDLLAMQFSQDPPGLESVLNFMEQSHCPWAGPN
jgi:PilZ domain